MESINLSFKRPHCLSSADLSSNHGTTCTWTIGNKDKTPCLSGTLALETGLERLHVFPTFKLGFTIMGIALSGLRIEKLDLQTIPPRLYKGFRAQTRAGDFDVRL
ncbi:unnamed protein product [Microthlaspi erraticum]|uniref:MHD domain-containing protein n=1 Tax=Microthlaspi erraticum TaxID=1685480 RepID=A0A6D2KRZ0_9BRAS|nr:unnamed protein product [Microthlaspi erraticum]